MAQRASRRLPLAEVIRFSAGKAIAPGGSGLYPVFGSNGRIGACDEYLYENAIIIGRVGAYCGSVVYEPGKFWSSDNTLIAQPLSDDFDIRFLYYLLHGANLRRHAGGAAQPLVTQTVLRQVEVNVPPLVRQRRIASILSAYDDLIENCERRIRVLDEMARALYREWFVLFHYPGHENTPLVDSPMGRIPKGWTIASLGSLTTKIGSGSTPRGGKESYQKQGMSLIRSLNVYDDRFELDDLAFIDETQARQLENVEVKRFDVLLNITGASVARCTMVPTFVLPARVNQHVAIVRADPSRIDPYFLLDTINSAANKSRLLALAQGGATREALTKETISSFEVLMPPLSLIRRYGEIAATSGTERETLRMQIENLRKTRDLLLPRLLSGQLPVEDLHEKQLEESP